MGGGDDQRLQWHNLHDVLYSTPDFMFCIVNGQDVRSLSATLFVCATYIDMLLYSALLNLFQGPD